MRSAHGIWGLGQIGDPQDLPLLGALLGDDQANDAAEESLKDFGAAAEPVLVAALDRPDGVGVLHALDALGAIGDPGAVARVARCLEDEDWTVRSWAIEALADIGERGAPAALEALRVHAEVESDPDLRDLLAAVLPTPRGEPGTA